MAISDHVPAALPQRKKVGFHWCGGWMDPKSGRFRKEENCPTRIRTPVRPARSVTAIPTDPSHAHSHKAGYTKCAEFQCTLG
jgi:hypothetical protein